MRTQCCSGERSTCPMRMLRGVLWGWERRTALCSLCSAVAHGPRSVSNDRFPSKEGEAYASAMGMLTVRLPAYGRWTMRLLPTGCQIGRGGGAACFVRPTLLRAFSPCALLPRVGPQELMNTDKTKRPFERIKGTSLAQLVRSRYKGLTLEQNVCAQLVFPSVRRNTRLVAMWRLCPAKPTCCACRVSGSRL